MSAYGQIVIIKRTGEDGSCFPVLTKTCKIGRGNVCDIRVQRDGVSDEQCIIETRTDAQVWIRNLTHNKTLLNGVPISNKGAALQHKDIFVVSDRAFRWEYMPGSKFYCVIKDDSAQNVKAPSEIIRKDEKDKVQTDAVKHVGSPSLRTPGRKSNRRSILETVTNVRGWSVFDMSDRSEKLHHTNVLQSPAKPTNNSTFDLIDFEDSVRSYLEEEIESSGVKQRGSVSILKRSLRKSNNRRGSATPKLLKSTKKPVVSSSKMLEDKNSLIPKKLVASDYANSSLSSLEKVNLEVSDFTVDSSGTLDDSVFNTKESESFVGSPAVEENLTSHVTVGRTRGRRFSSDNVPFVTPALLKRPSNKREPQFSNSVGSIVDSVKGNLVETENSVSCDSRLAATDESSFVSSNLSDNTGCGDESMNENHSLITSEEESVESMSRAFVNVRMSRRCKNIPTNSSPFVTPAILKSMKRNVRKSSIASGLSLGEQKLSLSNFDEVDHIVSSPKSRRRTRSIPAQSSQLEQEVEEGDGDHSVTVHSVLQSKACDSPTSVKVKSRKTPHKKFMGKEEDPQPKSSRKTRQHNADAQDEFDLAMSSSECMDEASQVFSEGGVDSILSYSVASTANATNGTLHSVLSESFISTAPSSSSLENLDSAKSPIESSDVAPNAFFDGSVEYFETNSTKEKIMKSKSEITSQGNISVSKREIVENDKENLDEPPLGPSCEEIVDMSPLKSSESNLFLQRSPRRSLRKSLQNIPNQEITDSVLEDQKLMTPDCNIPDISAKDESVKSKRKTRKSTIEQENVPINTDEKEEYGKGLENEEDRMDLTMSNIVEASTASSVKSTTKTPKARKSLGDLSLIETNAVKSNRKSLRYSKSRGLDNSSTLAFIQEVGVNHSKTSIAGDNEQSAKIKSARSLCKTRNSEIAPKGDVSIIGNSAGIVKVVDDIDSGGVANKESSLICNLSVSKKSSRRTPGKIKLARCISDLASLSSQEEIDSCFEGLMGDLLKTPVSKITSEGRKSLKKEKKSGIKSKNVSFNLDHTSMSIRDTDDKMASSLIDDECDESLINPLDSSLTSFGKLRSSSGKCKGVYTFSSTPISNTSRKLNLSKNPTSVVVQKAVHSPITEEEAVDIAVSSPKTMAINFDALEESTAAIHEVSESDEKTFCMESNVSSLVEDRTSSKSLLSALSSVKSNKTTPGSRKSKTSDSLLCSPSLGFSLHLSDSSYYEDAISDLVKIPSTSADKDGNKTREEPLKAKPAKESLINDDNITENYEEISSVCEENTTVVEHMWLDGSRVISSAKRRSEVMQVFEDSQTGEKVEELRSIDETGTAAAKEVSQNSSLPYVPITVKSTKGLHRKRKGEMDVSKCLEGVSDLLRTPAVENTRSLRKNRKTASVRVIDNSLTGENIEELQDKIETNIVAAEEEVQESSSSCPQSSGRSSNKLPRQRKEDTDKSQFLEGVSDLFKTPEVETTRSLPKLRKSVLEGAMEDSLTGDKIEEVIGDNKTDTAVAEAISQESSSSFAPSSVKSTMKMQKEEMDKSQFLEGVSDLLKTPAVETTRSLRELRRCVSEGVMEDSLTGEKIEEVIGNNETDTASAKEISPESSSSFAPSSVKSTKKMQKKEEMDKSQCLEGVSDLLKTPAVETTRSLRKLRKSVLEGVMEDSLTGDKIEEVMGDNESDTAATEEISQESSSSFAPSSVKSTKKMQKEEMDKSQCLEGVSDLLKTPAVETTRSLRKLRKSALEGVMEDSLTGDMIEEVIGDNESDTAATEEISQESSSSFAPSSVKSTKKMQKKEEMDKSQCLEGVSDLLKTPAVETTRSLRKLRKSVLEGVMEDSLTGDKIEEVIGDNESDTAATEEISQESSSSFAPSSVKSTKKMQKEEMDKSQCLEGVSNLLKTPAVETTRSLRKLRKSALEGVMEDSLTGDKIEEVIGDNESDTAATEEISQESSSSFAPSSVKSTMKMQKEEMDKSQCLEGVSNLLKTPAVETTRSLRKLRKSALEGVMEDSLTGDKIEEVMGDNKTDTAVAEAISQESLSSFAPSSVKSTKKMQKEEMDKSQCLEGVSDLLKTPAVGMKLEVVGNQEYNDLESNPEANVHAEDKEGQDYSIYSPSSWVPCSMKSIKKSSKFRINENEQLNDSSCLEGFDNLFHSSDEKSTKSVCETSNSERHVKVTFMNPEDSSAELQGDNDIDDIEKECQDCHVKSLSTLSRSLRNSTDKISNHGSIILEPVNDTNGPEGVGNLMSSPALALRKNLCVSRSEIDPKMEDSVTESMIREVRSDNDFSVIEEIDHVSVINNHSLSLLSSVKSTKKTPKHIEIENDHINDTLSVEGDLMETPTVKSSKILRKLKQYGIMKKGKDLNLEESSEEVSINIEDDDDLAEEIRNESLIVHPPSSAQSSVRSIKNKSKQRKEGKEKSNDSICLEGVSRLMETPATKSASILRKSRRLEERIMEGSPTEGNNEELKGDHDDDPGIAKEVGPEAQFKRASSYAPSSVTTPRHRKIEKKLDDISERCVGDADEPNLSHIKEDGVVSLVQSPARNMKSSQKLRKNIGKSIGGSGRPPFSSTPVIKRPNKSLNLSNNFESVLMINSRGDDITCQGVDSWNSRKSELNAENVDSSLVKSSELIMFVNETKIKTPNSNKSWLVSDLTPTSSQNSINVTGDTSDFEIENRDKMKGCLAVGEGGSAIRKTSLSVRSTRRLRSQLEDSSLLSDSCTATNEKAHDEVNESSVLGDVDCSWVTSSTFSFVRTPESSKIKSSEKKKESEIGTKVPMGVGDAPLMNIIENTGTGRLDAVDEKQEGPKTEGETSSQSSDGKVPVLSYENVRGVKEVMTRRSPLSRYSDFIGVKELFAPKSPTCSYENVNGVKELMSRKSPESRYSGVEGLRKLFNQKSPVCDYGNVSGVQDLFNVSSDSIDKQIAVVNTGPELSDKSKRENNKSSVKLKSAVVIIQKLDGKPIDHAPKKDNSGVRNPKSKQVGRGSDEEGADKSSSLKPDICAELLQSTAENQGNPVRLSGKEKITNLPKSSESDAGSGENRLGQTIRRGRLQKSKEKDANLEGTEDLSSRSTRRALRGNKSNSVTVDSDAEKIMVEKAETSTLDRCNKLDKSRSRRTKSLSVSEESEPLPERTEPSISNSVGEEYQSNQTNRRGRLQKSKSKEKDMNIEASEISSSTSRRALRRNKSTSDTVGEDSKTRESNERSSVQESKSKEKDQKLEVTVDSSSTGRRALRRDRSISLTMSEESVPLPKTTKISSSIRDTVDERSKTKEASRRGRVEKPKSKEKDQELERTVDSSKSESRALRGNRSNSLTLSEESQPVPETTKASPLISDTVDEESKTKEPSGRGRGKKSKSKEKDQELEGAVDSSSTGRRALRRNRSTSVTTETDANNRLSKRAEVSLDSCDEPLNLLPKKTKSVRFEVNVKESVDMKILTSDLDSGDKLHSLRQKRTKSLMSEENEPLPKRTKPSSMSDAVVEESKSSQANGRGKPQKSKSKEKDVNLEATEDLSRTNRRSLRGNKSSSEIIEIDAKEKEMEVSCVDSKPVLRNVRQKRTTSLTLSEESESSPKTTKGSLISDADSGEGKLGKSNRRGRLQKSKPKDNELILEGTEDLSSTSRRTLRGNKSTSIIVMEEKEPLPKRTKPTSSVSDTIDEESNASQASERVRVQKSISKEKDVNLKGTEDSSNSSRHALRGNKSTGVAIETDAKKRVGKKAEVSTLDSCNNLGKLRSKRTKSLSASEENEPSPKRTKHGSTVGEIINEESKSSKAGERGRAQKSNSKEKDVRLEVTEDSSSTSRRTLRGNKSTSSTAVSEGVLKKNASKRNKNTASPKEATSEKDNGKATDAKSAKMENISKIREQKSKPLKKDLSVNEVRRITRMTSVDKGGDSEETSHKKEIPLKNKGVVEKVVGRVTRRRQ